MTTLQFLTSLAFLVLTAMWAIAFLVLEDFYPFWYEIPLWSTIGIIIFLSIHALFLHPPFRRFWNEM
jgi:hypothetical protein